MTLPIRNQLLGQKGQISYGESIIQKGPADYFSIDQPLYNHYHSLILADDLEHFGSNRSANYEPLSIIHHQRPGFRFTQASEIYTTT